MRDPREILATSPMSVVQVIAVAVTIGLNALDGFDVLAISFASNKESTMTGSLTLGTISQISRTVRNIQEAQRWYGEVLGLKPPYTFGNLAFFRLRRNAPVLVRGGRRRPLAILSQVRKS